jgi:hypothetical protein
VAAVVPVPEDDFIDKEDLVADRERIESAGLNPDAPIGDLADQLEDISDSEPDDPLDDILQSFDNQNSDVAASADNTEDELDKLADILDIPDHSDAFLENVEIAKRPLGGGDEAVNVIGAAAVGNSELDAPNSAEAKADREFIEDSKGIDEWLGNKKPSRPKNLAKKSGTSVAKPVKKSNNIVLYILLIVLFLILGVSIGVLAFFSGLF